MNIKAKSIVVLLGSLIAILSVPSIVLAAGTDSAPSSPCAATDTSCLNQQNAVSHPTPDPAVCPVDAKTNKPDCNAAGKTCQTDTKCDSIFTTYLTPVIQLLSAAVGVIVVAVIIFSGIQFSSSGGDPQAVASAKSHIQSAVVALIAFIFLWAFLNFLIPGGVFNG